MLQAWVGDGLVPAAEARVSVFDRGFRTGEGVFETLRAYGSHPFRLDAHLERAASGALRLGFDLPPVEHLREALLATAAANVGPLEGADAVLRLTVTPGVLDHSSPHPGTPMGTATVVVTSQALVVDEAVYRDGVMATVVPWSRQLPQVKALSYLSASLARAEAQRQGAFEALLTDDRGNVLEGSFTNIFALVAGRLVTPPVDSGILDGVTRGVIVAAAAAADLPLDERPISLTQLQAADEIFLTATTREVIPVTRVAGRRVGAGRPGPVTAAIHEAYRGEVRAEIAANESGAAG